MRKIIVATDYSAEAKNAANYAAAVAAEHGDQLILFNLSNLSIHALNARASGSAIDQILYVFNENLNKEAAELSKAYKVEVVPHLATGIFYDELVRCINDHKADLVVMGMASKTIEQDLLGNTTTSAIHRLQFPILAVPLTAKYNGIKNVLFACDTERGVQEKVLNSVHLVAADFKATVEVFHVQTRLAEIEQLAEVHTAPFSEPFADISYSYKNVQSPQIIRAIQEEIKTMNADLLIMVPYQYGFWSSIVHRSKTRMMASGSHIPLLSLPF